jgi:hypothetical protein
MADLIEQLIANPGLYCGSQSDPTSGHASDGAARVVVTPLPGGSGVALDYEILSPENGRVHDEHSVLARTARGVVLTVSHAHAALAAVLQEAEPGYFPAKDGDTSYPMAVRLEVPEAGRLVYSWSYGSPGEELKVRDVGTLRRV